VIWRKVHPDKPLRTVSDPPYPHDVQRREPDVAKAKKLLGFEATTPLETVLGEVIPWIREQIASGRI
jgi:nucleoside-diphosphate-sugar epimerase